MLQFRIERSGSAAPPLPSRLSALASLAQSTADERPLRLGFGKGRGEQVYPFHCHNLEHEDGGMMLRVKVG